MSARRFRVTRRSTASSPVISDSSPVISTRSAKAPDVDSRGRPRIEMEERGWIDSWFIGFALVENPKIAWAVVVEGEGYGARRLGANRGQSADESEEPRIIERRSGSAEAHALARKCEGAAVSYQVFEIGSCRAPGLRNVALTALYFHDSNVALIESGEPSRSN